MGAAAVSKMREASPFPHFPFFFLFFPSNPFVYRPGFTGGTLPGESIGVGEALLDEVGAEGYQPSRRSIPLAAVGGTLDAPEVQLAGNSGVDFATGYAKSLYSGKLKGLLDKELGQGAGQAIGGALEGIFGGDREPTTRDPPKSTQLW